MSEMFAGDIGLMLSALLFFAGMTDFMVLVLFFSKQQPGSRATDISNLSPQQKKMIHSRQKRYQLTQFVIAMSGLLMVAASMFGISTHVVK